MPDKRRLKIEYVDMPATPEWAPLPAHFGQCLKPGQSLLPGDIQRAIQTHCGMGTSIEGGYDQCISHWRRDMHPDGSIVPQPGPTPRDDLIKACKAKGR